MSGRGRGIEREGEGRRRDYRRNERERSKSRENDRRYNSSKDYTNNRPPPPSHKYNPPTTESLHAKKLASLDHQKFLIDRQKQRDEISLTDEMEAYRLLWPRTPERAEFYFGKFKEEEQEDLDFEVKNQTENIGDEKEIEKEEISLCNESCNECINDEDSEEFSPLIRVKAPSVSKPSINSFSTSKPTKYGSDMMPGEGTAMAGFVASGQRIPRRGEIGLDSNQITRFETAGYVMSGSRHHLMNAVRMRKENQVISAEEKRMISQMAIEERIKREEEIVKTFKSMVDEKLKQNRNNSNG